VLGNGGRNYCIILGSDNLGQIILGSRNGNWEGLVALVSGKWQQVQGFLH
jgi:hypothetical protein